MFAWKDSGRLENNAQSASVCVSVLPKDELEWTLWCLQDVACMTIDKALLGAQTCVCARLLKGRMDSHAVGPRSQLSCLEAWLDRRDSK